MSKVVEKSRQVGDNHLAQWLRVDVILRWSESQLSQLGSFPLSYVDPVTIC